MPCRLGRPHGAVDQRCPQATATVYQAVDQETPSCATSNVQLEVASPLPPHFLPTATPFGTLPAICDNDGTSPSAKRTGPRPQSAAKQSAPLPQSASSAIAAGVLRRPPARVAPLQAWHRICVKIPGLDPQELPLHFMDACAGRIRTISGGRLALAGAACRRGCVLISLDLLDLNPQAGSAARHGGQQLQGGNNGPGGTGDAPSPPPPLPLQLESLLAAIPLQVQPGTRVVMQHSCGVTPAQAACAVTLEWTGPDTGWHVVPRQQRQQQLQQPDEAQRPGQELELPSQQRLGQEAWRSSRRLDAAGDSQQQERQQQERQQHTSERLGGPSSQSQRPGRSGAASDPQGGAPLSNSYPTPASISRTYSLGGPSAPAFGLLAFSDPTASPDAAAAAAGTTGGQPRASQTHVADVPSSSGAAALSPSPETGGLQSAACHTPAAPAVSRPPHVARGWSARFGRWSAGHGDDRQQSPSPALQPRSSSITIPSCEVDTAGAGGNGGGSGGVRPSAAVTAAADGASASGGAGAAGGGGSTVGRVRRKGAGGLRLLDALVRRMHRGHRRAVRWQADVPGTGERMVQRNGSGVDSGDGGTGITDGGTGITDGDGQSGRQAASKHGGNGPACAAAAPPSTPYAEDPPSGSAGEASSGACVCAGGWSGPQVDERLLLALESLVQEYGELHGRARCGSGTSGATLLLPELCYMDGATPARGGAAEEAGSQAVPTVAETASAAVAVAAAAEGGEVAAYCSLLSTGGWDERALSRRRTAARRRSGNSVSSSGGRGEPPGLEVLPRQLSDHGRADGAAPASSVTDFSYSAPVLNSISLPGTPPRRRVEYGLWEEGEGDGEENGGAGAAVLGARTAAVPEVAGDGARADEGRHAAEVLRATPTHRCASPFNPQLLERVSSGSLERAAQLAAVEAAIAAQAGAAEAAVTDVALASAGTSEPWRGGGQQPHVRGPVTDVPHPPPPPAATYDDGTNASGSWVAGAPGIFPGTVPTLQPMALVPPGSTAIPVSFVVHGLPAAWAAASPPPPLQHSQRRGSSCDAWGRFGSFGDLVGATSGGPAAAAPAASRRGSTCAATGDLDAGAYSAFEVVVRSAGRHLPVTGMWHRAAEEGPKRGSTEGGTGGANGASGRGDEAEAKGVLATATGSETATATATGSETATLELSVTGVQGQGLLLVEVWFEGLLRASLPAVCSYDARLVSELRGEPSAPYDVLPVPSSGAVYATRPDSDPLPHDLLYDLGMWLQYTATVPPLANALASSIAATATAAVSEAALPGVWSAFSRAALDAPAAAGVTGPLGPSLAVSSGAVDGSSSVIAVDTARLPALVPYPPQIESSDPGVSPSQDVLGLLSSVPLSRNITRRNDSLGAATAGATAARTPSTPPGSSVAFDASSTGVSVRDYMLTLTPESHAARTAPVIVTSRLLLRPSSLEQPSPSPSQPQQPSPAPPVAWPLISQPSLPSPRTATTAASRLQNFHDSAVDMTVPILPGSLDLASLVSALQRGPVYGQAMQDLAVGLLTWFIQAGRPEAASKVLKGLLRNRGLSYSDICREVRQLSEQGGMSPLHLAVQSGSLAMVEEVAGWAETHGSMLAWDELCTIGVTPLHMAAAMAVVESDEGAEGVQESATQPPGGGVAAAATSAAGRPGVQGDGGGNPAAKGVRSRNSGVDESGLVLLASILRRFPAARAAWATTRDAYGSTPGAVLAHQLAVLAPAAADRIVSVLLPLVGPPEQWAWPPPPSPSPASPAPVPVPAPDTTAAFGAGGFLALGRGDGRAVAVAAPSVWTQGRLRSTVQKGIVRVMGGADELLWLRLLALAVALLVYVCAIN